MEIRGMRIRGSKGSKGRDNRGSRGSHRRVIRRGGEEGEMRRSRGRVEK